MNDAIIPNTPPSTNLETELSELLEWEAEVLREKAQTKASIQRSLNSIAQDKALLIRRKHHALMVDDFGGKDTDACRGALRAWCRDKAGLKNRNSATQYLQIGELLANQRELGFANVTKDALLVVASKKFSQDEFTSLSTMVRNHGRESQVTPQKIHMWAHEECARPLPPKVKKLHHEGMLSDRVAGEQTIHGRLRRGYGGYALLGLHRSNANDVVDIVCRSFLQKFHPDKGGSVDDFQRIRTAVEEVRKNG